MSITRIELWNKEGELKTGFNSWFVYTAYAPMGGGEVLVKVGISTIPYDRLVSIYCNCPFRLVSAGFTPVGRKKGALKAESRILETYQEFKTRGEWLRLKDDKETAKGFAESSKKILELITGKPVKWQRVSGDQIRLYMSAKMKGMEVA